MVDGAGLLLISYGDLKNCKVDHVSWMSMFELQLFLSLYIQITLNGLNDLVGTH
jgi:hypothetical protein